LSIFIDNFANKVQQSSLLNKLPFRKQQGSLFYYSDNRCCRGKKPEFSCVSVSGRDEGNKTSGISRYFLLDNDIVDNVMVKDEST
jgi:hypothetical protein